MDCKIYWERDCKMGEAPKRTKCPKCKTLSNRYWQNQNVGISFCDDGSGNRNNESVNDFHTVRRRYQKHAQKGYDKDSANRFLHNQIRDSKAAQDDESYRYKGVSVDWDKFAESRDLRKCGTSEVEQKIKTAKELTADAYDKANKMGYKDIGKTELDISKPSKNS